MGIVTCDLGISLDGYSAGPNQSLDQPFGDGVEGGESLHSWMFDHSDEHRAELAAITAAGAFIMGRNMFGPGRGSWDLDWVGWWGPDPPYHAPVYVLTHVEREPVEMAAAPRSTSSPVGRRRPWSSPARRRETATSPSPAG